MEFGRKRGKGETQLTVGVVAAKTFDLKRPRPTAYNHGNATRYRV